MVDGDLRINSRGGARAKRLGSEVLVIGEGHTQPSCPYREFGVRALDFPGVFFDL